MVCPWGTPPLAERLAGANHSMGSRCKGMSWGWGADFQAPGFQGIMGFGNVDWGTRMPTVVIIHAAEDTLPARALAEKLRQAKLTVVLEKSAGEELRAAAKAAQVCIALWSPRSAAQTALVDDAGASKAKTVHVIMQSAQIPEPFQREKSVNLTGWRGEDDFPGWRELAKIVTDKAGVAPLPPPAPRPPSGFFEPGAPNPAAMAAAQAQRPRGAQQQAPAPRAPQARAPAQRPPAQTPRAAAPPPSPEPKRSGNGLMLGVAALVAVAVLGGGGYYFWSQSQGAQTSSAAWEEVERNDAASLRTFIEGAQGSYREEALAALAELEERSFEAASDADSIESLEAFLTDFPDSEHAIAVRGRIAELESQQPTEPLPSLPAEQPPTPDPDLVPPDAAPAPQPAPDTGTGPVTLAPPTPEPTPAPPPT